MEGPILVTGGTGTVGREVARLLAAQGVAVRVGTRHPAMAAGATEPEVDRVRFDFRDPATFGGALRGVRKLFLLCPPDLTSVRRDFRPCVEAARRAGVEHVVFLSVLGAERNPLLPHFWIERLLRSSGMATTLLRASYVMQNLSTVHRQEIKERGELYVPAGRGRTGFVDARDVAAVAAVVFTAPGHLDRTYRLTGPAAVDFFQVARLLTEALSRPVFYRDPSTARYVATMLRRRRSPAQVAVATALYTMTRLGLVAAVSADTASLLRRPPIPLRTYIEDYQDRWT